MAHVMVMAGIVIAVTGWKRKTLRRKGGQTSKGEWGGWIQEGGRDDR